MSGSIFSSSRKTTLGASLAALALTAVAPLASGAISYSEDFEGLDAANAAALGDAGFLVFANIFAPDGTTFLYNYGAFAAPNGSGAFSNVAAGEGGPDQGAQQIVTFSDYNNTDQNVGNVHDTVVFQERTLTAADAGAYRFTFDAKRGDLAGASMGRAYVLTLDPNAGFSITSLVEVDLTAAPTTWDTYTLNFSVGAAQAGQLIQWGFGTRAANFEASGIVYDNMNVEAISLEPYEQDFEGLDAASPTALSDDNWVVFGNVFDATGTTYLYGYGTFEAPNGSGGFSNVGVGEGGSDQGDQQIVVFNDYNNADHNNGFVINSSVFQEQRIGQADVGQTYVFSFDAKLGDLMAPTTANAFLKTLDPNAGFFTTNLVEQETETLPTTWGSFSLELTITADLVGQILQFGFDSTTSSFTPSGVVYDNISFGNSMIADADGDGVADDVDNCVDLVNADQRDSDGDGYGNACDADLNNDCTVNFVDLGLFRLVFFSNDADADLDGDGVVNVVDLGIMRSLFFGAPGPSGQGGICDVQ